MEVFISGLTTPVVHGVFSSTEAIICEDLGWFERGQAARAFAEGKAEHIDPSGGRLSLGHRLCLR